MRIKFKIEPEKPMLRTRLFYSQNEMSFDMLPKIYEANYYIQINYIQMTTGLNDEVIRLSGFCPIENIKEIPANPPTSNPGTLYISSDLEPGWTYSYASDWTVRRARGNWICIGDCESVGEGVEFLESCVAVLNDGDIKSLWLQVVTGDFSDFI